MALPVGTFGGPRHSASWCDVRESDAEDCSGGLGLYARPRDIERDSRWWVVESGEGSDLAICGCEADEFVCCVAFG